jgi:outer membrane protein TolC
VKRILVSLFACTLVAQEGQVLPLSMRRAIELAIAPEGDTRVELAGELIAQGEARRRQARAALLPNLDSSISYQDVTRNLRAFGIQFPTIPGLPPFSTFVGPFGIFDARTSLGQTVLDVSAIRRYRSAQLAVQALRTGRDAVRLQVTDQVVRTYLAALLAESRLETAKANLEQAERLFRLAERQKDAGTGVAVEVTRAQVQLAHERQRLLAASNERAKAHLNLLRALGLRLSTQIQLTDRLSYQRVVPLSLEQALEAALRDRPDWKAQQERERAAAASHGAAKAESMPRLSAFADYGSIGPEIGDSRVTRSAGIALRLPLFDGGRRQALRAESASQWRSEQIRAKDLRQQIEMELRIAFDNLRSAELQTTAAEEGLRLAERELEQAVRRYQAGVAGSLEVTDAQTRLARARDNRLAALFQHNLARLDLGAAMGTAERFLQ